MITPPPREPWWKLYLEKFSDPIIRVLVVAAILASIVGLFKGEPLEGVAIIVTIFLATFVGFFNEYKAGKEFDLLLQARDDAPVKAVRDGEVTSIARRELVVDDVVLFETGDEIAADGDLLEAVSLLVDESKLTGESFPVSKVPGSDEVNNDGALQTQSESVFPAAKVYRGTMVREGHGVMIVNGVGDRTEIGRTARSGLSEKGEATPLGCQLEKLSLLISLIGAGTAGLIFIVLLGKALQGRDMILSENEVVFLGITAIAFFIALKRIWIGIIYDALSLFGFEISSTDLYKESETAGWFDSISQGVKAFAFLLLLGVIGGALSDSPSDWFSPENAGQLLRFFMVVVAIIVIAVPEGLAMSVTLSLAYGMRKMMQSNILVRNLRASETVGATTVICSDKTGTLTKNLMEVQYVFFPSLGKTERGKEISSQKDAGEAEDATRPTAGDEPREFTSRGEGGRVPPFIEKIRKKHLGFSRDFNQIDEGREDKNFLEGPAGIMVLESIAVNGTAHLCRKRGPCPFPIGNPTEGALLMWLDSMGIDYLPVRAGFCMKHQWAFSTERKFMGTLGYSPQLKKEIVYFKGAPDILLERCTGLLSGAKGLEKLSEKEKAGIYNSFSDLEKNGYRTLGFAFQDYNPSIDSGEAAPDVNMLARNLVWIGCVGIADPVRPDVKGAIDVCRKAGIIVKIVTGDSPQTALGVARQIGLWEENDNPSWHLSGSDFQKMSEKEALEIVENLKILSRARPLDKLKLVNLLRARGHVVAVTGDGTNDAPALKAADVGLSMGQSGTDMAKEAGDIVLLDDSFSSIVTAIKWGRSFFLNIQRFLVFQITINIVALGITLLGPFFGIKLPLTVIQMLWVNLIMDTFAALAYATEQPDDGIMNYPPRQSEEFILSPAMLRTIFPFAFFSLTFFVSLLWFFHNDDVISIYDLTVFFTTFILVQFWNLFNVRRFGQPDGPLSSIFSNQWFLLIAGVIFLGQVLIVQFGGTVFRTVPLEVRDWFLIIIGTFPVLLVGQAMQLLLANSDRNNS